MFDVKLQAPGKNALSTASMTSLLEQLDAARNDAVLLTGAGDCFCSGLNLKEVISLEPPGLLRFLALLEHLVERLFCYPAPTVAWINGHAIAGGCVLALACDHRLVTPNATARLGLNEVANGLRFPPKTWRMIARRLPAHTLDRVVLEGALYAPEMALRLGLVDEVVASEADARAYAERVAEAPRDAYVAAKRALRDGLLDVSVEEARHFEEIVIPEWCSPTLRAKLAAALQR
jgi:enoyl-CoA hydratase